MAHVTEIAITQLACTDPNFFAIEKWLERFDVNYTDINARLAESLGPGDEIVGLAGKRCYLSFVPGLNKNVTKIRESWVEYLDNILASGHGSVLEHVSYTFAIEGVSRVFTGELNRHRAGCAISEGSMRYIRYDDIPYWLPDGMSAEEKKIFQETFSFIESQIIKLYELWKIDTLPFKEKKIKTSLARRLLPMGTATGGIWTFNLRALRHIISMRCTPEAEVEICYVFSTIAKMMLKNEPGIFGDFEQDEQGFWKPKYWKV